MYPYGAPSPNFRALPPNYASPMYNIPPINFENPDSDGSITIIVIIVALVIILVIVLIGLFVFMKKKITKSPASDSDSESDVGSNTGIDAGSTTSAPSGVVKDSYVIAPSGGLRCPAGYEQPAGLGGLCYQSCKAGFHAAGCCTCSPNCPAGFNDIGVSCLKPSTYTRAVGTIPGYTCPSGYNQAGLLCTRDNGYFNYTWGCGTALVKCHDGSIGCKNDCYKTWIANLQTIPATQGCPAGKVAQSGLCYDAPRSGYKCDATICSNICPAGFSEDGLYCGKPASYGRGVGITPTVCPDGQTRSGALCYPACKAGYVNLAGVCTSK